MQQAKQHIMKQSIRKRFVLLLGFLTLIYAFCMPDRNQIFTNYIKLLGHHTYLMHDFVEIAGLSATFLNIAALFFVAYYLMSRNERSNINGLQMSAIGIYIGHSFFGTHLLNIAPIILGVVLYARWTRQSFKLYTTVSLFATATAPIVSFVMLTPTFTWLSFAAAMLVGLLLGFIAPPLAEEFLKFHHGMTLYNFGFTTGIIAMFIVLFFPYFDWEISAQSFVSAHHHYLVVYYLLLLALLAIPVALNFKKASANYLTLLKSSGRVPNDFSTKFGIYPTLFNICLNGIIFGIIVFIIGAPFNGPTLGALCSILGFSAFGKHPRNALPISLGVAIASFMLGVPLTELRTVLAMLFGTALSPIAGSYGFVFGALAGFLHYNLTAVTLPLHQGMTLYNNGFSTGFVAAFLVPIIDTVQDFKDHWIPKK